MKNTLKDAAFKAGFIAALSGEFRAVPSLFGFSVEEANRFYNGYDAATDLSTDEHSKAAQKYFRHGAI